jgi:hypothetical protein
VKTHDVESVTGEREQRDGLLLRKIHWVCVCLWPKFTLEAKQRTH